MHKLVAIAAGAVALGIAVVGGATQIASAGSQSSGNLVLTEKV